MTNAKLKNKRQSLSRGKGATGLIASPAQQEEAIVRGMGLATKSAVNGAGWLEGARSTMESLGAMATAEAKSRQVG